MLQNFITSLPQLEALVNLKFVAVDRLAARPVSDDVKYAGKIQQPFQVACNRLPPNTTLAMRAVEDVRADRPVLVLVMYDNIIAGKEVKGELVYRHTFFIHTGDVLAAQQFANYVNNWVNNTLQQLVKPVALIG